MITLNDIQLEAARHLDGPMLVLAGPGSGKTTVIAHRFRHLVLENGINPSSVLIITFAKASANEMKERVADVPGADRAFIGTFHAFFFGIIRRSLGLGLDSVLSEEQKRGVISSAARSLGAGADDGGDFLNAVTAEISLVKNEMLDISFHNPLELPAKEFRDIFRIYEEYKREHGKIDFDDMLSLFFDLLRGDERELTAVRNRFKYIMVDEFQDINRVQYECLKLIGSPSGNLLAVGDDDQSIYRFRGSRPEFMLGFPNDFPGTKKLVLPVNYRSTDEIINAAGRLVSWNRARFGKEISGTGRKGPSPEILRPEDFSEEAGEIARRIKRSPNGGYGRFAVLYRTNMQARALVDSFMDQNIPFAVKDEIPDIYSHFIAADFFAYLRLAGNRGDNTAFERIANRPSRYLNKALIARNKKIGGPLLGNIRRGRETPVWLRARLEEMEFYLDAIKKRKPYDAIKYIRQSVDYDAYIKSYAKYKKVSDKGLFELADEIMDSARGYESLEEYQAHIEDYRLELAEGQKLGAAEGGRVTLSTIHSAKGLEFDTVFVSSALEGVIPYEKSKTAPEIEEERRLFYVALTRAKNRLYVSAPVKRHEQKTEDSRFLAELLQAR